MENGETGRYLVYTDGTISALRYWLTHCKLPSTSFPKQALIMPRNSLITNTSKKSNWAGCIKDCLESYGFHDVWINGGIDNNNNKKEKLSSPVLNNS